jgi:hypothetical protein
MEVREGGKEWKEEMRPGSEIISTLSISSKTAFSESHNVGKYRQAKSLVVYCRWKGEGY